MRARNTVAAAMVASALGVAALGLAGCESAYPEGVETDAREVRSVTMNGTNYEVVTYDDGLYELPVADTEVLGLEDSGRDFMSRDHDTLWLKEDTAECLGLAGELEMAGEAE